MVRFACAFGLVVACSFEGAAPDNGGGGPTDGGARDSGSFDGPAADAGDVSRGWGPSSAVTIPDLILGADYDDPLFVDAGDRNFLLYSRRVGDVKQPRVASLDENFAIAAVFNVNLEALIPSTIASPWIAEDGLTLVYSTSDGGGAGGSDFFVAKALLAGGLFRIHAPNWFENINSARDETGLGMTADMRTLVYSVRDSTGVESIHVSERTTTDEAFPIGRPIAGLEDPSTINGSPRMSRDGLAIVFAKRTEQNAPGALYISTRQTTADEFGAAVPLVDLSVPTANDSDPTISADLRQIWFASDRDGGQQRLYRASRE